MSAATERSILGAVLLNNALFQQVASLKPVDFSLDSHRVIFSRIRALSEVSHPIDLVTLTEELARHGELEAVGGAPYVSSLIDGVPDLPSVQHYVGIIREASNRKRAAERIEQAHKAVADPSVPASALAAMGSVLETLSAGDNLPPRFSEDALALRFSKRYEASLRYVHRWGAWLRWDETRWIEDSTLHVFDLARGVCRDASAECTDSEKGVATKLASKATSAAVERLAGSDRRHAATVEQWDTDPWLLNTPLGTIDLRLGQIRKHCRTDYLTKITAAGPSGNCPLWLRFLDRVTDGDCDLQTFLQRMVGYCLTGITREHALFFLYGTGTNGKSVFLSTVSALLGSYGKSAPASSFTASATEQHPTDLAGLRGARFVTAIETEDGARWAESKIKSLTGGDKIAARFMRCDFFEFVPEFKLVIAGNHKPRLRSVDEAIRRRLHLVPFAVAIPDGERDLLLSENLRVEFPGILAWAAQGCLDWQRDGLNAPSIVRDATAKYLAAEDAIGRWITECCVLDEVAWASSSALYLNWKQWCERNGEYAGSQKRLSEQLEVRGLRPDRNRVARGFLGVQLVTDMTRRPI